MNGLYGSGVAAVLGGQHLPRDVLVQALQGAVDEYPVADLLLEEGLDEVDDGVDDGADVDHVHLLELDRVGLLHADQELLHEGGRELGEVGGRRDARVQDVDVAGDPDKLLLQPDVADHQDELHRLGDVRRRDVLVLAAHHHDAPAVLRQARQWRHLPAIIVRAVMVTIPRNFAELG